MKSIISTFLYLILTTFYLFPLPAGAAIGVSPDKLEFSGEDKQTLFLRNLGDKTEKITIELENKKRGHILNISPREFYLGPNESMAVAVNVVEKANFKSHLAIVSQSEAARNLNVASGIKIPVRVGSGNWAVVIPGILALAVTIGSVIFLKRAKI